MKGKDRANLAASAGAAASLLKALANEKRLMIVCELSEGERSVGALVETVGLSQSALSQHLAKLRAGRFVMTRRRGQTIYYSLADPAVIRLVRAMAVIFCPPRAAAAQRLARRDNGRAAAAPR